jgi:hypothetical protein
MRRWMRRCRMGIGYRWLLCQCRISRLGHILAVSGGREGEGEELTLTSPIAFG